jgi:hypothetical protein
MTSFGQRLRAQRERERIALADVAERTKIRAALLEGLERDDLKHWPAGIFRRSYVRDYARAIHLDPETVVAEFLAVYPEPVEEPPPVRPARFRFPFGSRDAVRHATVAPQLDTADDRDLPAPPPEPIVAPEPFVAPEPIVAFEPVAARPPIITPQPIIAPPPTRSYLPLVADLCTATTCAQRADELTAILARAATLVDAAGLIVWLWDAQGGVLRAGLSHGFAPHALAQLGGVMPQADNALAKAFRSKRVEVVASSAAATGALVVPLLTPWGCGGVLALELRDGREGDPEVVAIARILAAQFSTMVGDGPAGPSHHD